MELLSLYYTRDFYSWKVAILFYAYVKLGSNLLRAKEEPTQMNVLRGFMDYDIFGSSGYEIQISVVLCVKNNVLFLKRLFFVV